MLGQAIAVLGIALLISWGFFLHEVPEGAYLIFHRPLSRHWPPPSILLLTMDIWSRLELLLCLGEYGAKRDAHEMQ